jgi:hypothetical protein
MDLVSLGACYCLVVWLMCVTTTTAFPSSFPLDGFYYYYYIIYFIVVACRRRVVEQIERRERDDDERDSREIRVVVVNREMRVRNKSVSFFFLTKHCKIKLLFFDFFFLAVVR